MRLTASSTRERFTTHGKANTPENYIWRAMIQRCTNPLNAAWEHYGGRGINICDRWLQFENFLADMGNRPEKGYSIERVDNNKGYFPSNCIWLERCKQLLNTRRNRLLTFRGETKPMKLWSEELGISYSALRKRLNSGWSVKRALTERVRCV